jgi:hypothetical protein
MTFKKTLKKPQRRHHVIAFRLNDTEYLELLPFFEAFDGCGSDAMRWLLNRDETMELMQLAVKEATGV